MGREWDKVLAPTEIWKESFRVLKPGGFAFVMSAPRADVQYRMIQQLESVGFRIDFTPIYWTYASGFPKALNMGKIVDKRMGVDAKVVRHAKNSSSPLPGNHDGDWKDGQEDGLFGVKGIESKEGKEVEGSFGGYQPKPSVEIVLVAMKPLSKKTYVDQILLRGKEELNALSGIEGELKKKYNLDEIIWEKE